jgi:hypothetical protein
VAGSYPDYAEVCGLPIYRVVPADNVDMDAKKYYVVAGVTILVLAGLCFFFKTFPDYVKEILSHWMILMSGVASVGITFFDKVRHSMGKYGLYSIALLCVFFAGYQAWQDQQDSALALRSKLDAMTRPIIGGEIDGIGTAVGGEKGNDCIVAVTLSVTNKGAPTSLDVVKVVLTANGKEVEGVPIPVPKDGGATVGMLQGGSLHYERDDLLYVKTIEPLQTGKEVTGVIFVIVNGVTYYDAHVTGAKVTVVLQDIYDNKYPFSASVHGMEAHFPDIRHLQPKN